MTKDPPRRANGLTTEPTSSHTPTSQTSHQTINHHLPSLKEAVGPIEEIPQAQDMIDIQEGDHSTTVHQSRRVRL